MRASFLSHLHDRGVEAVAAFAFAFKSKMRCSDSTYHYCVVDWNDIASSSTSRSMYASTTGVES